MTKRCARCGHAKPVSEFTPRKDRPSGLSSHCRVCLRDMARAHRSTEAGRAAANRSSRDYGRRMRARSTEHPESPGN